MDHRNGINHTSHLTRGHNTRGHHTRGHHNSIFLRLKIRDPLSPLNRVLFPRRTDNIILLIMQTRFRDRQYWLLRTTLQDRCPVFRARLRQCLDSRLGAVRGGLQISAGQHLDHTRWLSRPLLNPSARFFERQSLLRLRNRSKSRLRSPKCQNPSRHRSKHLSLRGHGAEQEVGREVRRLQPLPSLAEACLSCHVLTMSKPTNYRWIVT